MGTHVERANDPVARPVGAPPFELVAIASSAGGLAALTSVLSGLPGAFPAAVVLVQHLDPRHKTLLADMLGRRTELRVKMAEEGDHLTGGCVYIAPPNYHLVVNAGGTLSLSQSELIHFLRPSADILFESVAARFAARAIAVVLSGTGSDGARGVQAIKKAGGTVIAQDEDTSEFFGMPSASIATGTVDIVLPLALISSALVRLLQPPPATPSAAEEAL
ncbi:MAG: two-component system, chemotaxis family, protein-glutamate methylesterase/glutaminase [Actinomycetota bacterium]|jgi:two-component system chemotaxis response regulator CheB|nr:two-component system, chemotaxis family, protein-glutamate methylesterase/glutaminase [Actinomycetota bacterium]